MCLSPRLPAWNWLATHGQENMCKRLLNFPVGPAGACQHQSTILSAEKAYDWVHHLFEEMGTLEVTVPEGID